MPETIPPITIAQCSLGCARMECVARSHGVPSECPYIADRDAHEVKQLATFRALAESRLTRPKTEEPQRMIGTKFGRFAVTHQTASNTWLVSESGPNARHWLLILGEASGLPCCRLYPSDEHGGSLSSMPTQETRSVDEMLAWLESLEAPAQTVVTERPKPKGPPEGWASTGGLWFYEGASPRLAVDMKSGRAAFTPERVTADDLLAAGRALMDLGAYLARTEAK